MIQQAIPRPPVLIVARASVGFLLQCVRAVTRHVDGDILGGITVLALLQGTYAHLSHFTDGQRGDAVRPISRPTQRRMVSGGALRVRASDCTLIALGWC